MVRVGTALRAFAHPTAGHAFGKYPFLRKYSVSNFSTSSEKSELPTNPMSADRVRWEHIQRIYEMCNRNVSETARRLNMLRRTLQRMLAKRAPR